LWPLVLAALALTLYAWHLDTLARRRARLNFCPKCNYDRTGLPKDAVCPECGAVAAALKPTESATHA
jgi:rubrerythrin